MTPILETREGRALAVQILTKARKHLARTRSEYETRSTKHRYICHAIHQASLTGSDDHCLVGNALRRLIVDRMGGPTVFEDWLQEHHGVTNEQCKLQFTRLQRTRRAWVDSLIEEFSK